MNKPAPSLVDSPDHFKECHDRWMQRRNRETESSNYQDEWFGEQCMFCRYYIPLAGVFTEDYGACSNARSVFDGVVRFEHDGCPEFVEGEWWEQIEKSPVGQ